MAIKYRDELGRIKRLHELVIVECKCGNKFETSQDRIDDGRGKHCSKACMYKYRNSPPIHDDAKYSAVHKWIAKKYGQKMECENCGLKSNNPYKIQWANLDGKYSRDINTWSRMCAKCHWHYDRNGVLL